MSCEYVVSSLELTDTAVEKRIAGRPLFFIVVVCKAVASKHLQHAIYCN